MECEDVSQLVLRPPEVEALRVIRVAFLRGTGETGSPVRRVLRYYDRKGRLLVEDDPLVQKIYPAGEDGGSIVPSGLVEELLKPRR